MKRAILVLLALGGCKKAATTPPPQPESEATDGPSCEDIAANGALEMTDDEADNVVTFCRTHPEVFSAEVIACMVAVKVRADADRCDPDHRGDEPEPEPRRSEAELMLDAIKAAEKARFGTTGGFVVGSAPLTPSVPCCASGTSGKCAPDPSLWTSSTWVDLDFAVTESHYYQVSYNGAAGGFVARAVGDLDCDGAFVTYTLEGDVDDRGEPVYTLTKPAMAD